jgi:soluble lytic murein transglycosylase-like protein
MARLITTLLHSAFLLAILMMASAVGASDNVPGLSPQARKFQQYFEEAAMEFNVPVELLQGIAYAETRWQPIMPKGYQGKMPEHAVEVESHQGKPVGYGIMSLHDDPYFGHSLLRAARLIGQRPAGLQKDTRTNIRGAAALLSQYGAPLTRASPLESWEAALARYSGINQRDVAQLYTYEIFTAIYQGRRSDQFVVTQRPVDLEKIYGKKTLKRLSAN